MYVQCVKNSLHWLPLFITHDTCNAAIIRHINWSYCETVRSYFGIIVRRRDFLHYSTQGLCFPDCSGVVLLYKHGISKITPDIHGEDFLIILGWVSPISSPEWKLQNTDITWFMPVQAFQRKTLNTDWWDESMLTLYVEAVSAWTDCLRLTPPLEESTWK
jgi:hypothetical protein